MNKRIGIFGVGAVGSYIGAFLTREGHDVTLIDMWGEHVDVMNQKGLRVTGTQGEFTVPVKAVHLTDAQDIKEPFDIAFLAVKSYDTEWMAHFLKRFISPTSIVVGSQNCMNDRLIASIVGYEREIPCVMSGISVALWEPGHVTRGGQPGRDRGHDVFRIGELHGQITNRVNELVEMVSCIDGARATTNIWGERWSKLTTNASSNPIQGMTGLGSQGLGDNPRARLIQIHISKESAMVGLAHNVQVEPIGGVAADVWARADRGDVLEELDAKFQGKGGGDLDWKASMGQDVAKGRRTEVEYMNGYIVEAGREVGVSTPVNAAIVEVVKEIDAGLTKPDPSNIERVLSMAGL
ncbi:MAG: 2-dehydropantoate 2-reductase [Chloroflexi bacterium]|nr:2-dehydropantoate 2-reductase [Chloroflexota bacterium]